MPTGGIAMPIGPLPLDVTALVVGIDMQGQDVLRDRHSEAKRTLCGFVPCIHGDDDQRRAQTIHGQLLRRRLVLAIPGGARMERINTTVPGITSSVAHAPSVNLETTMIQRGGGDRRANGIHECAAPIEPFSRSQCITIPACDMVNARKAPTAKSGISRSVTPPKAISRMARERREDVDAVREHQPPAPVGEGVLGKKSSSASSRQRRGNPAKPVLAESQHRQHRADGDVVEDAAPDDRPH